jgi:DNA sulfur modification protein DndC
MIDKHKLTDPGLVLGHQSISTLRNEVKQMYLNDKRPWVIGYSGGKDSTAVLRLVYESLAELPVSARTKPVFVVTSDTLVETPVIVNLIGETLATVQECAMRDGLPINVAQVTPKTTDTFWVNLIGKGYPAPTRSFRWCTERMKIDPVSEFIRNKVATYGEVIVVLGSRSAESSSRAQVMKKHKIDGTQLARHTTLVNAFVYTPIEAWSADDVWEYLFSGGAPWGGDHQALFNLYKDSNAGECPLVIDTSTPSCGNSRFGCWVCTVVTQDRAMDGLVESGLTWLVPLQEFRNGLFETTKPENKHKFRSDKRRSGKVTIKLHAEQGLKQVLGPYRMEFRQTLLRRLLATQRKAKELNPDSQAILITKDELEEIRRCWRNDPNEPDWSDPVPSIYLEVMNANLDWIGNDQGTFGKLETTVLTDIESEFGVPKELVMKLIETELMQEGIGRRSDLFKRFDEVLGQDWDEIPMLLKKHRDRESRVAEYDSFEQSLHTQYEQVIGLLSNDL